MRSLANSAWALGAIIALSAAPAPPQDATSGPIERLEWLAGCWVRGSGATVGEEFWTEPNGGIMLGSARTVRNGVAVEYEHLILFTRGDTVIYRALPSGQAPAEFAASHISDTLAVFENPRHDFPRLIRYRRAAPDSLHARVEGPARDGRVRGIDFRYGRTGCPG